MATKTSSILIMLLVTVFISVAQFFFKKGSANLPTVFFNWPLLVGIAIYGIGAILFIYALKYGEVTVLYPILATTYIWVSIVSIFALNESFSMLKATGIFAIAGGVMLIGLGSKMNAAGTKIDSSQEEVE